MNPSGSCLCGAITYTCSMPPLMAGNCHCADCRKVSGSGYAPLMFFPENAVTITGTVKYHASEGGSGRTVQRGFCGECGSQMFGMPASMPGMLGVRAGSLDDPSLYRPQVDIFVSHAPDWDAMDPALHKFEEMPPTA